MALPEGFNEFEFLQDTLRRVHNKIIREEFSDLGGDDWDPDITVGRGALRHACTMKDDDSGIMESMRMWLFYVMLRKASDFQIPIYGIPTSDFQEVVEFRPQVKLVFAQDSDAVPDGKTAIRAEIGFRLINETSATMTEAKALKLAKAIKTTLITSSKGYVWSKGKILATYKDPSHGYSLQIYAMSDTEAETIIKKILEIQDHTFDADKFTTHTPKRSSVNNPSGTSLVYGKQRSKQRWRPTANVRFRYASLQIHGLPRDVILVDTTGYFPDALAD